jgi:hypothetical protein
MIVERDALVSGIGRSELGRRLPRSGVELTLDACLAAIADAGLTPHDIDGLTSWPPTSGPVGRGAPSAAQLHQLMRFDLAWMLECGEGANPLGALGAAAQAVGARLARHVLVYRTVTEASAQGAGGRPSVTTARWADPWWRRTAWGRRRSGPPCGPATTSTATARPVSSSPGWR